MVLDDWIDAGHKRFLKHRKFLRIALLICLASIFGGPFLLVQAQYLAAVLRDSVYHSTLRSYQTDLRPGVNRKDVETYLRAKNTPFVQFEESDEVMIGKEHRISPFCGPQDVFVEFRFSTTGGGTPQGNANDTLKTVSLIEKSEGCL